jgi:hypothetical protein
MARPEGVDLLRVMLELRAQNTAIGAQLDRLSAQMERQDARLSVVERLVAQGAVATAVGGYKPTTAPAERVITLQDMSADMLGKVIEHLDTDSELAASLASRKLRIAIAGARRPLRTTLVSLLSSVGKLRWGISCGATMSSRHLSLVARRGDLPLLSALVDSGCQWPSAHELGRSYALGARLDTCEAAARGGHLSVLQWARASGCPWNERTCSAAARGGHLAMLQWARANGCPWNQNTCSEAARDGHLAVLQWARANCCPWDSFTCEWAAGNGHLAVGEWARANGCPDDMTDIARA